MKRFFLKAAAFMLILLVLDFAGAALLKKGVDQYYGLDKPAEILCVGHSRVVCGIDEELIEARLGRSMTKYAMQGTSLENHYVMIQQYLDAHPGACSTLLYIVDDFTFGKGLGQNQYRLFFPFMDAPCIADHVKKYANSWSEYVARIFLRMLRFSDTTTLSIAIDGLRGRRDVAPDDTVNIDQIQNKIAALKLDDQYRIIPENITLFEHILALARSRGLRVVLFYIPFIDLLSNEEEDGRYDSRNLFVRYAEKDSGIVYIEAQSTYMHNHKLFSDATHPNKEGQIALSDGLVDALNSRTGQDANNDIFSRRPSLKTQP